MESDPKGVLISSGMVQTRPSPPGPYPQPCWLVSRQRVYKRGYPIVSPGREGGLGWARFPFARLTKDTGVALQRFWKVLYLVVILLFTLMAAADFFRSL